MRSISSAFVCRLLVETPAFSLSFIYDDKNDWVSIQRYSYQSGTLLNNVKKLIYLVFLHIIGALSSSFQLKLKWAAANQSFAVIVTIAKAAIDSFSRCFLFLHHFDFERFRFVSCTSLWCSIDFFRRLLSLFFSFSECIGMHGTPTKRGVMA